MSAIRLMLAFVLALGLTGGADAVDELGYRIFTKNKGSFDDVAENVKDAIVNRGFVVDYVGYFNKMLERTAEATGTVTQAGSKSPYKNAQYVQFCPAKLTHEAVNVSPFGIANCPIAVFVYETTYEAGKIQVGFRLPVSSPSKRVREINQQLVTLLQEIATEATK